MKPNTRPALGRAPSRNLVTLASALAAVALVGSLAAAPARAGWTSENPIPQSWNTRPAIAMDGAGHLGVAWQEHSATPGILYATDAAGPWASERVSTGDDWLPDLVFDGTGAAHVAFVRFGPGAGLYLATNTGGAWVEQQLRADVAPWSPSIAIDAAGKLHIAYASEGFTPGIWYLTNASGSWVATRVSTGTWDSEPSLALGSYGAVHIAYARYERPSPGLLVATNAGGSWSTTRVTTRPGGSVDDYPALVIDAENVFHLTALRWAADGTEMELLYATDLAGEWIVSAVTLPAGTTGVGIPAIGLDASGKPEIVARLGSAATADNTLWRFTGLLGGGASERLITGAERSEDLPDILRDTSGKLVVAHRAGWHAPGVIVHHEDPDTDEMVAPSVAVDYPSIASGSSGLRLAFERYATDASDGTSYASDASGAWVDETIAATHGKPALGVTYGDVRRVAIPDRLYSSTETGWDVHPFAVEGGSDVAIDTGHPGWQVAYLVPGIGVRVMFSSFAEEQATTNPTDEMPGIAALQTTDFLLAVIRNGLLHVIEQWWGSQTVYQLDAARAWDPAVARGVAGSVMTTWVAYDRGDSAPGIVLARSGSIPWSLSRLSRAYADVTPAIAVGEAQYPELGGVTPIFVTWARACGGPDPGLYLATNRTGSWVTTRLASGCDIFDPAITLVAGRPVVAYTDARIGIVIVRETDAAGSVAPAASAGERSSRATADVAGDLGLASVSVGGLEPAAVASGGIEPAVTSNGRRGPSTTTVGELAERFVVDR